MSLVVCPECGKEISDMAKKCVHCGYRKGHSRKTAFIISMALLLQLTALVLMVGCNRVYSFDGYYHYTVYSEYGSEFDYSGWELYSDDSCGNIFLTQASNRDPEVETSTMVDFMSYVVIAISILGAFVYIYTLLRVQIPPYFWLMPLFAAGCLLIHSIVVSVSYLGMVETWGYYEARPSIFWFVILVLEIVAALLGKKVTSKQHKAKSAESQNNTPATVGGFVDAHGIYHDPNYSMQEQDE